MPGNRKKFRHTALASGLVTSDQFDHTVAVLRDEAERLPEPTDLVTDEGLATQFVEAGVLTQYQADQLLTGRSKLDLGPYTITDWIGQGGMGQVFKAVHKVMGREVAVKVLPLAKSSDDAIFNFSREVRTQALLDHPNLVRAFDAGHDGNVHYLVTEFVPGTDLRRLIRAQTQLDPQQAAHVIMQAAQGLDYAHSQGLIHRDVKPGNLLVTPEGHTKVSDLGLAGFVHEGDADPRAGKIVGTADYIAPELVKTPRDASAVSDIYSLGCSLYYAVTGKVPFPGGTSRDKLRRHCEETPWHPRRFVADLSEELIEVIADMMEKDPRERIQTAAEVVARLEPFAGEVGPRGGSRLAGQRWTAPPLPSDEKAEIDGLEETESASNVDGLSDDLDYGTSTQASQGTVGALQSAEETTPLRPSATPSVPPSLPQSEPETGAGSSIVLALAIAVPVSLLLGALLMLALQSYVGSQVPT